MKSLILGLCLIVSLVGVTPALAGGGHGHHTFFSFGIRIGGNHNHHGYHHHKRRHHHRRHYHHNTTTFYIHGSEVHRRHHEHRPPIHHRRGSIIYVDHGTHWHVVEGAPFCTEHWAYHVHHHGHTH